MNFFKKIYCRTYQTIFKILLPLLPYKEPVILSTNREVANILNKNSIDKVLIITDSGISKLNLMDSLIKELSKENIQVFIYDKTVPNPTTQNVSEAVELYKINNCKALLAFGGGSPIDCAKATGAQIANPRKSLKQMKGILKVRKKLPLLIAVPTTAGTGSETTLAAVITDSESRFKYAINDFPLIPNYALLDAKLTVGLPKHLSASTGIDALTHAIEAYIGRSTTKLTRKCAKESIKIIFENIEEVYFNPTNLKARESMLKASYLAGVAFTRSYVGYVHAVAHSLGGKYNIAHGLANAIILPVVLKKYGKSIHKKLWELGVSANLFSNNISKEDGAKLFIEKIEQLNKTFNIPNKVEQLQEQDIKSLAITADKEANPLYPVPKLFSANQLEEIYLQLLK